MKKNDTLELPPIRKSIEVRCAPTQAFALFTAEIHVWWPLATHSISDEAHESCTIEPRVGGRVFERDKAGREYDWGTVLVWEPPACFRMTWRVGKAAHSRQEVEVRFEPTSSGGTRVTLTHSGWSTGEPRDNYDTGWDLVLGRYVERTST